MAFIYEGNKRRAISFPLGGIGSGCIGLSGYGQLVDWEIFNRPNKGSSNGMTHFAVKAEADGEVLDARVLHADIEKDCAGSFSEQNFGHGVPRTALMGLPHFRSSVFRGAFPFAQIDFDDGGAADAFPGKVSLEAFNPFIPTNEDDSSLPAAFFTYTVENTTNRTLTYTLAGSLKNPFSEKGGENRYERRGGCHVLRLCDRAHAPEDFAYGDFLSRHGWFACALGQFEERGRPMGERPATPSPARPRRTPWALLIQWVWKVEPERCPCGAMMRRSRAILERHELVRLLTALHLAGYPRRPPAAPIPEGPPVTYGAVGARRSTPPPRPGLQVPSPPLEPPQNEHNQVPPGWEDWLD